MDCAELSAQSTETALHAKGGFYLFSDILHITRTFRLEYSLFTAFIFKRVKWVGQEACMAEVKIRTELQREGRPLGKRA
jgi:hypothetical protein